MHKYLKDESRPLKSYIRPIIEDLNFANEFIVTVIF